MIDLGQINEAENILLDNIDYTNKEEVMAAALFYQSLVRRIMNFWRTIIIQKKKYFQDLSNCLYSLDIRSCFI